MPTYLRHPVVMATEAPTVQPLSGGRLTLGIGPSHAWPSPGIRSRSSVIAEVFRPTTAELAAARALIATSEAGARDGRGVVELSDGRWSTPR